MPDDRMITIVFVIVVVNQDLRELSRRGEVRGVSERDSDAGG